MEWKPYIVADPQILSGKPIVKGTRLAVDFLLDLFAQGWTKAQVLESYPQLTEAQLQAVFSFSADRLRWEESCSLDTGTGS